MRRNRRARLGTLAPILSGLSGLADAGSLLYRRSRQLSPRVLGFIDPRVLAVGAGRG